MDLIALKHYLRERKITPLQDAAHHFQVEVDAIRPLFEVWLHKGKLRRRYDPLKTCKGCCKCDPATVEIYEWLD
nr:FeoC-like transcriptional regulator [uncultured Desulfobulbus sp.]